MLFTLTKILDFCVIYILSNPAGIEPSLQLYLETGYINIFQQSGFICCQNSVLKIRHMLNLGNATT